VSQGKHIEIDPQRDTYDSRVRCGNCGHEERVHIPKGQTVAETPCPRCQCKTVGRVPWSIP
jgi:transcription elongation factor Elf1